LLVLPGSKKKIVQFYIIKRGNRKAVKKFGHKKKIFDRIYIIGMPLIRLPQLGFS
jgi:hypothetical protein